MNSTDLGKEIEKFLQQSFYVTLGATASLLEVVQDASKRKSTLNTWQQDLDRAVKELVEKGVVTEVEARSFVDRFVAQNLKTPGTGDGTETYTNPDFKTVNTVNTVATDMDVDANAPNSQAELRELTQQLADLRAELEQLRN
jgi:polyhydroxyalkanoate synthesis regulator phasin